MEGQKPNRGTAAIMATTYTIQGGTNHSKFFA